MGRKSDFLRINFANTIGYFAKNDAASYTIYCCGFYFEILCGFVSGIQNEKIIFEIHCRLAICAMICNWKRVFPSQYKMKIENWALRIEILRISDLATGVSVAIKFENYYFMMSAGILIIG